MHKQTSQPSRQLETIPKPPCRKCGSKITNLRMKCNDCDMVYFCSLDCKKKYMKTNHHQKHLCRKTKEDETIMYEYIRQLLKACWCIHNFNNPTKDGSFMYVDAIFNIRINKEDRRNPEEDAASAANKDILVVVVMKSDPKNEITVKSKLSHDNIAWVSDRARMNCEDNLLAFSLLNIYVYKERKTSSLFICESISREDLTKATRTTYPIALYNFFVRETKYLKARLRDLNVDVRISHEFC